MWNPYQDPLSGGDAHPHFADEESDAHRFRDLAKSTDMEPRPGLKLPWWVLAGARLTPTGGSPRG